MLNIALVGNQNSGKTSLFNVLTGNNQKIGNWAGVTVDIAESLNIKKQFNLFDLPGIYSLSPYSLEEKITRDFIFKEKVDLIINILDATILERSLYLTTQLLELDIDVVAVLNMFDIVEKQNIKINIEALEKELGITIIPISVFKNYNIDNLIQTIINNKYIKKNNRNYYKIYPIEITNCLNNIVEKTTEKKHAYFNAVKFFEKERSFENIILDKDKKIINSEIEKILKKFGQDGEELIASLRYDYISNKIINNFAKIPEIKNNISDKIDKIILNKFLSIPFFLLIIGSTLYISTILIRRFIGSQIELFFSYLSCFIEKKFIDLGISNILTSFVLKGIIPGASVITTLIPQIVVFFSCLLLIESTGYMARIAFSFEYIFRKFGLSGKAVIPFVVGMECTVSGIFNTRTIENENERKKIIVLLPFVICNTKLAVIMFLLSSLSFFKNLSFLFIILFYLESLFFLLLSSFILSKIFSLKKQDKIYIDELPTYKIANLKYVFRESIKKTLSFLKKIGTTILFFSAILWFLISFDIHLNFIDNNIQKSILFNIGNLFSWFFYLMLGGKNNWAASIISLYGLVDKEQIISSIKIIGFEKIEFLKNPLSSFSFLTFNLFSIPCFCTLTAMFSELKSFKKVFFIILFELLFAWFFSTLIGIWGLIL